MDSELKSNSAGWVFFVKVSFAIALFAAAAGVVLAPVDLVLKGYMAISALFLVSTTITLSKTIRDEHEHQRIVNRISEARTHQLLKEYGSNTMSIWRKLDTLFRASAQEPVAKLVDANGIRIFEQELRDAEQAIARSKRELACLMAEKTRLARDNEHLRATIDKREHQVTEALEKNEEELALELANLIAEDEPLLERQQQQHDKLQQQENRLRKQLRDSGRALKHFHSELRLARANRHAEQVNRQLRGHARGLSSHMEDLNQSVSRIQARQAEAEDIEAALTELDREQEDETLDSKLKAAGISNGKSSGEQVLARIRSRSSANAKG